MTRVIVSELLKDYDQPHLLIDGGSRVARLFVPNYSARNSIKIAGRATARHLARQPLLRSSESRRTLS